MTLRPTDSSALLIDGKLVPGSGGTFETINPATEEVLGDGGRRHRRRHGRRDRRGPARVRRRPTGRATTPSAPAACASCATRSQAHIEELREITIAEVGAPAFLTSGPQLDGPVADLGYVADLAETYAWEQDLGHRRADGHQDRPALAARESRSAWSAPSRRGTSRTRSTSPSSARHSRPATPSSSNPRRTRRGAPPLVGQADRRGDRHPARRGQHRHLDRPRARRAARPPIPRVDLVSFTGSTATGRKAVMAAAAETLKKVFLELGGKSAFIVLDDADLAGAVRGRRVHASCVHAGQGCAHHHPAAGAPRQVRRGGRGRPRPPWRHSAPAIPRRPAPSAVR